MPRSSATWVLTSTSLGPVGRRPSASAGRSTSTCRPSTEPTMLPPELFSSMAAKGRGWPSSKGVAKSNSSVWTERTPGSERMTASISTVFIDGLSTRSLTAARSMYREYAVAVRCAAPNATSDAAPPAATIRASGTRSNQDRRRCRRINQALAAILATIRTGSMARKGACSCRAVVVPPLPDGKLPATPCTSGSSTRNQRGEKPTEPDGTPAWLTTRRTSRRNHRRKRRGPGGCASVSSGSASSCCSSSWR